MKAIQKDFWREIRNTRSRFASILILVALAVAFLSGLRCTAPDMKSTCDAYLDRQNFMDIQVLSTLGMTEEDLEVLLARPEISGGEIGWSIDAYAHPGHRGQGPLPSPVAQHRHPHRRADASDGRRVRGG